MSERNIEIYEFGEFRLNVTERLLVRSGGGERLQLRDKAFEILCVLVRNAGHLVPRDELLNQVWAESFVEESNLDKCVCAIRRALGEKPGAQKFIETVRKHGFRFVTKVRQIGLEGTTAARRENIFQERRKLNPPAVFPHLVKRTETPKSGAVVALAGWRRETVEKDVMEPVSSPVAKAETTEQTKLLESIPAKSKRWSAFVRQNRPPFAALAAILFGAATLVYYFYGGKNIPTVADGKRSIAVLPVQPLTAENRDVIYEFGIADSLNLKLGAAKNLIVRPLSATRQYADLTQDAIAAGNEMQVDYVLASNYQIADGKIRVTSQLFNIVTGQIEETYKSEKDAGNIFATQDAIAGEVGNIILARFSATESSLLTKRGTTNEEAYRLYLQGTALADKRTQKDVRKAVEYFEQAVGLDPNYALAYARLANAQTALNFSSDTYPRAKAAIEKALVIDDTLAEAHSYLGEIKADFEWDFSGAEREHRKAIELNPNSSVAHRMYALLLGYLGRHDESIAESKTAIDLEPASVMNHLVFGRSLLFARRYDEAITELERTAEMDPEFFFAHLSLSVAYRFKGDDDRAFESFVKTKTLAGEEPGEINLWKTIYANTGWRGVFARQFEAAKEEEKNGKPNHNQLANLSIELGQHEQAFAYLEKTFVQRRWAMVMLNVNPRYDSLRSDPRFDDLVRRVGLK